MKKEEILKYYIMGWELSEDNRPFPDWFEFHQEKVACLLGYNDQSCGVLKENDEILEELYKIFGK